MNTQVGARAGFLEGLTFELGLEGDLGPRRTQRKDMQMVDTEEQDQVVGRAAR